MRDANVIVRERQSAIRRELDRRGISLKAIAFDAGMSYSTLLSYFPNEGSERAPAMMPTGAMFDLCGVIPDDLLSLMLPDGRVIVCVPEGIDHDGIEEAARDFLATKGKAHHPDSPGGREIAEVERIELNGKAARLRAVA